MTGGGDTPSPTGLQLLTSSVLTALSVNESVTCVYLGTITAQSYTVENPVFDVKRESPDIFTCSFNVASGSLYIFTANEEGEVSESSVSASQLLREALASAVYTKISSLDISGGANVTATLSDVEDKLEYKLSA